MEKTDKLKIENKKIIIRTLIVLVITAILGFVFLYYLDLDFIRAKTLYSKAISSGDENTPGSGELMLILLGLSGLTFVAEAMLYGLFFVMFFIIPVSAIFLFLLLNSIARLFQIGVYRNWKNTTAKVFLYFSISLQGIFNIYLILLSLSGFGWIYILVYLMTVANIYIFIKNIVSLRDIKKSSELIISFSF